MIAPSDPIEAGGTMRTADMRGLHRSYQARAQFLGAAIVASFFVIILGASVFLGAVMVVGSLHNDASDDLTANGRTGRIARPLSNGTLCHYVVFDNKTAQTVEDRIGRCDEDKPKPDRPATFTWGGK